MTARTIIRLLLDDATAEALKEIEKRVRKILRGKNAADNFYMAMGSATFYTRDGKHIERDMSYLRSFYEFLDEFDDILKLTGIPMRMLSADDPVATDW